MLLWQPTNKGDELAFKLPVQQAGRFFLRITAAKTPESGSYSAQLDGETVDFGGNTIVDLHIPHRTVSRTAFSPQAVELAAGDHILTLRYEGGLHNNDGNDIGIDFIWLQKR